MNINESLCTGGQPEGAGAGWGSPQLGPAMFYMIKNLVGLILDEVGSMSQGPPKIMLITANSDRI